MKPFTMLLLVLCTYALSSQGFLKVDGREIVDERGAPYLLKGMGLGGWMLQEGYMLQTAGFANAQHQIRERIVELIGEERTDQFYAAWLQNHVTREDIDSLKSWGFNSVRLPMHYNLFTLPIEEEPIPGAQTWLAKGFEMTDSLIKWCDHNDMYVILDLHAAPGGQGKDEGISDYDPDKPSLWESALNKEKTIELWKKLAETYKDEAVIAGYDLINETNWPLDSNQALRDIYLDITEAIRSVDTVHIIFIEGNWFANDFTNLTPPWDDNMVYSPHKYWSINDQASIQWVLDIRAHHNVPLYLGESGENSNLWFRDAIKLLKDNNIGWAWWPMKKIESIAGPLSIIKTPAYQQLLDYWNDGGNKPDSDFAYNTLMQLTELLKIENCLYQKDVIDAMFRQVESSEVLPYRTHQIPGKLESIDYDMGILGSAYWDTEVANYQVSTGNYTSWNNGWSYRNDGVDIEKSEDPLNTSGYHIGWIDSDEWLRYTVQIMEDGVYDVNMRIASNQEGGQLHIINDGVDITTPEPIPTTGAWQSWTNHKITDVPLFSSYSDLILHFDKAGFNLGTLEFTKVKNVEDVATEFISAHTSNGKDIFININKPLASDIIPIKSDFELYVDNQRITIESVIISANNRNLQVISTNQINPGTNITISYRGETISSIDNLALSRFINRTVENRQSRLHLVPGKIEAEAYAVQRGIQTESTSDEGGGENIGFLDVGDYCDYLISVPENARYNVQYRTAALNESGGVRLSLLRPDDSIETLHQVRFPSTGGWQNWTSTDAELKLPAGEHTIRMEITHPLFNINWLEFSIISSNVNIAEQEVLTVYPQPAEDLLHLSLEDHRESIHIEIYTLTGEKILSSPYVSSIDISSLAAGMHILSITHTDGTKTSLNFIVLRD